MQIWIPSSGRASQQDTWKNLPASIKAMTTIVVPHDEKVNYRLYPFVVTTPPDVKGIGPTRQWIIEQSEDKCLMLDDDLRFAKRRIDDPTKFSPATPGDIECMVDAVSEMLDGYTHGAISHREGANRNTDPYILNTRCLRALAYRADTLRRSKVRFDRIPVMEDFDVALQLLTRGYPSCAVNMWVQDQGSSNAAGGCSQYRTMEVQAKAAEMLAAEHPKYVTVVTKQTKTAWGGQERKDVRIQWKKAFAEP